MEQAIILEPVIGFKQISSIKPKKTIALESLKKIQQSAVDSGEAEMSLEEICDAIREINVEKKMI